MIKKNVLSTAKVMKNAHDGQGRIAFVRPFDAGDFETDIAFVDYVELPAGTSIGVHRHGENEEIYFVVEGAGTMTTNGERFSVATGDLIVNRRGWSHGLENSSDSVLRVLVWEVGLAQ